MLAVDGRRSRGLERFGQRPQSPEQVIDRGVGVECHQLGGGQLRRGLKTGLLLQADLPAAIGDRHRVEGPLCHALPQQLLGTTAEDKECACPVLPGEFPHP